MQLVNCLLALGGDIRNVIPKTRITVAEVAVLQAIHGHDAISALEPLDEDVRVSPRDEKARLVEAYSARDGEGRSIVEQVFPGSGAGMAETVDDLALPDEAFKVLSRITVKSAPARGGRRRKVADTEPDAAELFT